MWTTMLVWTVAVVLLPSPRSVSASGVFELRLKSFVNEYGKDSLGKCCSGSTSSPGGECSGVCKTRFRVCLKQYQVNIDTTTPCTYGDVFTPVLGDNVVNFDGPDRHGIGGGDDDVALPSFTNPIKFPFDFTWPGTFSLIVEAYHDTDNTTSHSPDKVLITRLTTQKWLDVGPEWIEDEHRSSHSRMVYEYRVTCAANYYGKGCENLCRPRKDNFGHYSCSSTGQRVCHSGWKGDYCATPQCLQGCDEQHGHCSRPNECLCHNGWTGPFCDQCVRYPGCLHGTCQKPWECLCDEGWGGLFCNQDLNFCTNHKPCLNGGTCFNTGQGSYTCSCAPGFTGTDCQTPLQDCHSKPCLNGGSCTMEVGGLYPNSSATATNTALEGKKPIAAGYRCTCAPGWRGRHCEVTSRSCRDSPCLHGSTCEDDSLKGYTCHCPAGFTGTDCETEVNECLPNPCENGGTCQDAVNGYRCSCPAGFAGERCEINVDDCQDSPCMNGATCVDLVNRFRCQCVPGFVGRLCQDKVDYCLAKPCANGGECVSGTNDYRCACKPGFTGKDCSVDVDECRSSPCRNGGTCRNRVNGFLCECSPGWQGDTCAEQEGAMVGHRAVLPTAAAASSNLPNGGGGGGGYWSSGNLSRHVAAPAAAEARDAGLTTEHVVVIATLSTAVPAFVLVAAVAVMCMKRRQKREQAKADEEARLQNERNAVHSSMTKRAGVGGVGVSTLSPGGVGCAAATGNGGNGISGNGSSVCSLGAGDAHMIKNTWTANKSVNNAANDLDSSFQTDVGGGGGGGVGGIVGGVLDGSCSGYKPEPILQQQQQQQQQQDVRTTTRATKQLNTDAAAHRASHLFQKEKDYLSVGMGVGGGVLAEAAKRSSLFVASDAPPTGCCADSSLLKRPSTITESGGGGDNSGCGVYVIDDHYRHDASLAATLATEV